MATTTLYFSKLITAGPLKGLVHHSSIPFPDVDHAAHWLRAVKAKGEKRLGYRIVDASFQNYQR